MTLNTLFSRPPLIHIGYPKCLSTWLQKKLFIPQNGYSIALDPLEAKISFIDPAPFRYTPLTPETFIKKKQICESTIPVITAESLAGNLYCGGYDAQLNADRLHQSIPIAKILIVIREQRSLIRSLYKTQVNWGMPQKITELLAPQKHNLSPVFNLNYLCFDGLINYYQEIYGNDNVLILPYELFLQKPHYFVHLINKHCNISSTVKQNYSAKQRINQNRPLIDIYYDRLKNTLSKTSFNYLGILTEDEERVRRRIANSKKKDRFPQFTQHWFEDDFRKKVHQLTEGKFSESNRKTEEMTGLNLKELGYE